MFLYISFDVHASANCYGKCVHEPEKKKIEILDKELLTMH